VAEYRRRSGFDTARELWKKPIRFLAYSTTGLTLPEQASSQSNNLFLIAAPPL
jgi:hypothetical protein